MLGTLALGFALGAGAYALVAPDPSARLTEFYALGAQGLAESYPREVAPGELMQVQLGIANHEGGPGHYRVEGHARLVSSWRRPGQSIGRRYALGGPATLRAAQHRRRPASRDPAVSQRRCDALPHAAAVGQCARTTTLTIATTNLARRPLFLLWGVLLLITMARASTSVVSAQGGAAGPRAAAGRPDALRRAAANARRYNRKLALALTLAPLIRLLSLSLPLTRFPQIAWYPIVAVPLFLAAWVVIRLLGISRQTLGLRVGSLPQQIMLIGGGLGLGAIEYAILKPAPLVSSLTPGSLWLPALSLIACTGLSEELISPRAAAAGGRTGAGPLGADVRGAAVRSAAHRLPVARRRCVCVRGRPAVRLYRALGGSIPGCVAGARPDEYHAVFDSAIPGAQPWRAGWRDAVGDYNRLGPGDPGDLHVVAARLDHARGGGALRADQRGPARAAPYGRATYTDLAQRTGLPARLLAEIEHGLRLPQPDQVQLISRALGAAA